MQNLGEELVGCYLRYIKGCEFVAYNSYTESEQGEIDVIGVNLAKNEVFVCEVAVHTRGLNYVIKGKSATGERLVRKFAKSITYAQTAFAGKPVTFMFWSPLIRAGKRLKSVRRSLARIQKTTGVNVHLVANVDFYDALQELRRAAKKQKREFKEAAMRLFQIEETLLSRDEVRDHVAKLKGVTTTAPKKQRMPLVAALRAENEARVVELMAMVSGLTYATLPGPTRAHIHSAKQCAESKSNAQKSAARTFLKLVKQIGG